MSSPAPIVVIDHNHVLTTSLLVAERFDKQHKNVLRDIENILKKCPDKEFNQLNFEPVKYIDAKGEFRPMYRITRDGFVMLASGFTGEKAFLWRIAFINAFNHLERLLLQPRLNQCSAMEMALYDRHPQWRETVEATQNGMATGELARRQGKSKSSVRAMKARIRAAGIDLSPVGVALATISVAKAAPMPALQLH